MNAPSIRFRRLGGDPEPHPAERSAGSERRVKAQGQAASERRPKAPARGLRRGAQHPQLAAEDSGPSLVEGPDEGRVQRAHGMTISQFDPETPVQRSGKRGDGETRINGEFGVAPVRPAGRTPQRRAREQSCLRRRSIRTGREPARVRQTPRLHRAHRLDRRGGANPYRRMAGSPRSRRRAKCGRSRGPSRKASRDGCSAAGI